MSARNSIYMKRLAKYSLEELARLRCFAIDNPGRVKNVNFVVGCLTAAMMIKAGLAPA